jgi:predicted transcriptional regulator
MTHEEPEERKSRYIRFRSDPEFVSRIERVADARFGENKSVLIRRAVESFIEPIERELAERETQEASAA